MEYFYEVVLYKLYPDRAECVGSKFYKTTSPYKGKTCVVKKLNKEIRFMKTIIEINI